MLVSRGVNASTLRCYLEAPITLLLFGCQGRVWLWISLALHTQTHTELMSIQVCFYLTRILLCCSHLFAIANISYTTMMDAKKDQCIVIRYGVFSFLQVFTDFIHFDFVV